MRSDDEVTKVEETWIRELLEIFSPPPSKKRNVEANGAMQEVRRPPGGGGGELRREVMLGLPLVLRSSCTVLRSSFIKGLFRTLSGLALIGRMITITRWVLNMVVLM